jgi:hypothetical protein
MDAFSQAVNGWHDFYIMVGTAAATLVGLLFVSLSLNADAIAHPLNADLRALAEQTFSTFLYILSFAIVFLIPNQEPLGLGLPLLFIGGFGLYSTIRHFLRTRPAHPRVWGRGNIARRFIMPLISFVVLILIAISVLLGKTGGLYWLIPVMIAFIVAATINAWDLLLRLREPHTDAKDSS